MMGIRFVASFARSRRVSSNASPCGILLLVRQRQRDVERRADTEFTCHTNRAAVRLRDRLHDRQAQPGATDRGGRRGAIEAIEDLPGLIGRYAYSRVTDLDQRCS